MLSYQDYEKAVYDSLLEKRKSDSKYNFSVRQKASKGAEKDYFIGTEKNKYFGMTFWNIPVGFPGSASDLIDAFFSYGKGESKFRYEIEFKQTKNPHDDQNSYALELIEKLEPLIENSIGLSTSSNSEQKIRKFKTLRRQSDSLANLLDSFYQDLDIMIPIVNEQIEFIREIHPDFVAHQYTDQEFDQMQEKLKTRRASITKTNEGVAEEINSTTKPAKTEDSLPPLNQILFGPPGTGKTYHTVSEALRITGFNTERKRRDEVKKEFDKLTQSGQIVFTTFHQSMSYEDFIEGIKPTTNPDNEKEIGYKVIPGLFKKLCIEASFDLAMSKKSKETRDSLKFANRYDAFIESIEERISKGTEIRIETKSGGQVIIDSISPQGNIIVKHVNGTREYIVSKTRLTKLNDAIKSLDDVTNINNEFREIIGGSNSSAYWSVLNAIEQTNTQSNKQKEIKSYSFEDKEEVVSKMKREDFLSPNGKNYVLIIDEINRGNISQIFGELITLLETDKRLGKEESLKVTLPYSNSKERSFGVPPNLFVIGTMNTADRSVEALDTALRRRFSFTEMPPKPSMIHSKEMILRLWNNPKYRKLGWDDDEFRKVADPLYELLGIEDSIEIAFTSNDNEIDDDVILQWDLEDLVEITDEQFSGINLENILSTINKRLEVLLDKDHFIGHSFFINVGSLHDLKTVFSKQVIPLLQEYFFGDYGKISLVLGEGFCKGKKVNDNSKDNLFASISTDYDPSVFIEKIVYEINDPLLMKSDEEFKEAIKKLLN